MSTDSLCTGITLAILNPDRLLHGSEPLHHFTRAGGSIGSRGSWQLQDGQARILHVHCEIGWHEGEFCIVDHSGTSFINDSDTPLQAGIRVRLKSHDRLRIAEYLIGVSLLRRDDCNPAAMANNGVLAELQETAQSCPLQVLGTAPIDPLCFLQAAAPETSDELDPLALLERAAQNRIDPAIAALFAPPEH